MRIAANLLALAALAAAAAGCARTNYTSPARYEQGLVVVLGGAGGGMMGEDSRVRGSLAAAGVNRAIEIFEWSQGDLIDDQVDVNANRRKADQLARRVEAYEVQYPGRPVHLVGVSAGTGLAIWALEDLSAGARVTGTVLLASSLGARYDLAPALDKVDDAIYSFNSIADTVLSIGVTMTGSVDRNGSVAGGLVGFSPPDGSPEYVRKLYKEKLVQIPWWPGDVVLGNLGDHLGSTNPLFIRARVSPIVLGRRGAIREAPPETAVASASAPARAADLNGPPRPAARLASRGSSAPMRAAGARGPAKSAPGPAEKSRFVDWSVAAPAPARPATDEAVFFAETGGHP